MMNELQNEMTPHSSPPSSGLEGSTQPPTMGEDNDGQPEEFSNSPMSQPALPPDPTKPDTGPPAPIIAPFSPPAANVNGGKPFKLMDPTADPPGTFTPGIVIEPAPSTTSGDSFFAEIAKAGLTRWSTVKQPINVYIEKTSNVKGFNPKFPDVVQGAFVEWNQVLPSIKFVFVPENKNAQINCTWTDQKADLLNHDAGGATGLASDGTNIVRADIKLYTMPPGTLTMLPMNALKRGALHEIGHALGLIGHSNKSSDVMYSTFDPKDDSECQLSERDKNTIKELYSRKDISKNQVTAASAPLQVDASNPKGRAMLLNNEAARAIKESRIEYANQKLIEANKLDPSNKTVAANLGALTANIAAMAAMSRNFPLALANFKKAIPLLELGGDKKALSQVLSNYAIFLRQTNSPVELKRIEAKLKALGN
jgi:predicted Zn-dependent protease